MALIDMVNRNINQYDDTDKDWKRFIYDHKVYLISQSKTQFITESYLQTYVYNLKRYLRSINYNIHIAWIVAFINNLPTDVMFVSGVNSLLLPPMNVIESLYTTYISIKSMQK